MTCGRCGADLSEQDLFCPRCGTLNNPQPLPPQQPPTAPAATTRDAPGHRRARIVTVLAVLAVVCVLAAGTTLFRLRSSTVTGHAVAAPTTPPPTTPATAGVSATVTASPTPTPTMDFATIYARQQSGVVRIETLGCSETGIGTGFLLSPTLIATVNHVIDQSVVVSLVAGKQRTTGTVIGSDPAHDLALVQANRPLSGYHFHFAANPPKVGDQVATIGFPIADPITLTHGDISGLHRRITVNGVVFNGLIETDAAINPGNSGGPLLATDGTVVGLIDALNTAANGIAYAIPADQASTATQRWQQAPTPLPPATCPNPLGPPDAQPDIPAPPGELTDTQAAGVVAAFNTYFGGINSGNYAAAYAVLSARQQAKASEEQFAAADATSYDFGQTVLDAHPIDATTVQIALAFTSLQTADKGPNGDTCDNWTLLYTMIQDTDSSWRIDRAQPYHGTDHTTC
jgi:serine protease Do